MSASTDFWACALAGRHLDSTTAREEAPAWAQRFAQALSAPLAQALLVDAGDPLESNTPLAEDVKKARLLNRLLKERFLHLAGALSRAGHKVVLIKGAAAAFSLYDSPETRLTPAGDIDLVVANNELQAVCGLLKREGLTPHKIKAPFWQRRDSAGSAPWFDGEGILNIDLHTAPDVWPLNAVLSVQDILASASAHLVQNVPLWLPAPAHGLAIQISNLAKDKFSVLSARRFVDTLRLAHMAPDCDADLHAVLRAASLMKALAMQCSLIKALGLDVPKVFSACLARAGLDLPCVPGAMVRDWRILNLKRPGPLAALRREWATYPPGVAGGLLVRRARGYIGFDG